jgi:hypothetical protein
MKKIFTQENLVGFGVAILAGLVAIAIYNKVLPAKIKSYLS